MKKFPIRRIGWREAFKLVRQAKYTVLGRELLTPAIVVKKWMGIYGSVDSREGSEAEYYLTTQSMALLKKALAAEIK